MPLIVRLPKNDSFLKKVGTHRSHLNVLDRKHTAVQRELSRGGLAGREPETQSVLLALCERSRERPVFWDVGAHIGLYSALIGIIMGARDVAIVAIEPTPDTAEMCRKIRDRNGLHYTVVEQAVSSAKGEVQLYLSTKAETSNSLNSEFRKGSPSITVKMTTLDALFEEGQPAPNVMKIDVETYEAEVLKGSMAMIRQVKPWIVCEFLTSAEEASLLEALLELERAGYVFHHLKKNGLGAVRSANEVLTMRTKGNRDWLCAPTPVDKKLRRAIERWREALRECTPMLSIIVEAGTPLPAEVEQTFAIPA